MTDTPTILLVDDSRFFLALERQFLQRSPARLAEAQNAEQALAQCRQKKPDLIYMDLELSGIRERRKACNLRVRFRLGERTCIGKGLDISSGGLFLECSETLKPGDSLKLEIQLSRLEARGPWIFCFGTVVWINTLEKPFKPNRPEGYGVKFTVISAQALGVLNGFLKSLDNG